MVVASDSSPSFQATRHDMQGQGPARYPREVASSARNTWGERAHSVPPSSGGPAESPPWGAPRQTCEERASRAAAPAGGGQARLWAPRATDRVLCRAGRPGARSGPQDPVCGGPQGRVTPPHPRKDQAGNATPETPFSRRWRFVRPADGRLPPDQPGCPLPAAPPSAGPAPPPPTPRPAPPPSSADGHGTSSRGTPPLLQPLLATSPSAGVLSPSSVAGDRPAPASPASYTGWLCAVRTQAQTQARRPPCGTPVLPFPVASLGAVGRKSPT